MGAQEQVDLSKYGTVNNGPVDLSKYGTVQGGDEGATIGGVASTMADQAGRALGAAWDWFPLNPSNIAGVAHMAAHPSELFKAGAPVGHLPPLGPDATRIERMRRALRGDAISPPEPELPILGEAMHGKVPEALGHLAGLMLAGKTQPMVESLAGAVPAAAGKISTAGRMGKLLLTDPEVIRAGMKVLPKGPAALEWWDRIQSKLHPDEASFEPFKPSPSITRKTQYGGPAPSQADAPAYVARGKGWTPPQGPLVPTGPEELPAPPKFETNPTVAKRMKFTPSPAPGGGPSYLPTPKGYTVPESSLTPEAPEPEIPNPEPFKPNPTVAKRMRFTSGQDSSRPSYGGQKSPPAYVRRRMAEEAGQGESDINSGLPVRVTPPPNAMDLESIAKGKFLDTTTPEGKAFKKLSLKDQSAVTEQALKYSTPEPVTSTVSPFKGHSAEMTDLIRQWHSQWPKGTSMRDVASQVYGLPKGTMPSYEQALKVHEYMLRNQGKIPTAQDLGLPKPPG